LLGFLSVKTTCGYVTFESYGIRKLSLWIACVALWLKQRFAFDADLCLFIHVANHQPVYCKAATAVPSKMLAMLLLHHNRAFIQPLFLCVQAARDINGCTWCAALTWTVFLPF